MTMMSSFCGNAAGRPLDTGIAGCFRKRSRSSGFGCAPGFVGREGIPDRGNFLGRERDQARADDAGLTMAIRAPGCRAGRGYPPCVRGPASSTSGWTACSSSNHDGLGDLVDIGVRHVLRTSMTVGVGNTGMSLPTAPP